MLAYLGMRGLFTVPILIIAAVLGGLILVIVGAAMYRGRVAIQPRLRHLSSLMLGRTTSDGRAARLDSVLRWVARVGILLALMGLAGTMLGPRPDRFVGFLWREQVELIWTGVLLLMVALVWAAGLRVFAAGWPGVRIGFPVAVLMFAGAMAAGSPLLYLALLPVMHEEEFVFVGVGSLLVGMTIAWMSLLVFSATKSPPPSWLGRGTAALLFWLSLFLMGDVALFAVL